MLIPYKSSSKKINIQKLKTEVELAVIPNKSVVPHKFAIVYDIGSLNKDSIRLKVDYLYDKPIFRSKDSLAFSYFLPGYAFARLTYKDSLLVKKPIYSTTKGWQCFYRDTKFHEDFREIHIDSSKGHLSVSPKELGKAGYDTLSDHFVNLYYMKDFRVDGDHFKCEVLIRNRYFPTALSKGSSHISLLCKNGTVDLNFCQKGNPYILKQTISEKIYSSTEIDMNLFTTEIKEWTKLTIKSKGGRVSVTSNGKHISDLQYSTSLGSIIGLRFGFKGLGGEVKGLKLYNAHNKVVFSY
jgi:hypothetical protein